MNDGNNQNTQKNDEDNTVLLNDHENENLSHYIADDYHENMFLESGGYSLSSDEDTQDLLIALQQGEMSLDEGCDLDGHSERIDIPETAIEKLADVRAMVEKLSGDVIEDDDPSLDEDEVNEAHLSQDESIPDMEIKDGNDISNVNSEINTKLSDSISDEISANDDATSFSLRDEFSDERNNHSDVEGKLEELEKIKLELEELERRKLELEEDNKNNQQPTMAKTNLAGGLGHAFGSVINGVFSGIGMALGAGLAGVKQTKDVLSLDSGDASVSNKIEAGAHFHFSPAAQAVNDSFSDELSNDWKKNRIDTEFSSLQMDVDSHLRAIDKLKQTEWAQKLNTIEKSGDPEMFAKAPAILNAAKAMTDYIDVDRDLSYFEEHINQRAERLSSMLNDSQLDTGRFENIMNKWQEEAKKRLDDLPDAKEKQGIIDRIQNVAQNVMAGIRSMFSRNSTMS
jgi:hypothetical protein